MHFCVAYAMPIALPSSPLIFSAKEYVFATIFMLNKEPLASNPAVPNFFAYSKTAVPLFLPASEKKAGTAGYEAKEPPLSGINRFSLSIEPSINPRDYSYYSLIYFLFPGANVKLHACIVSQPSDTYVIRGERNLFLEEHLHISKTRPENVKSFNLTR